MLSFIVRRTMVTVVILFLLSLATFTLLRIMPGDDVICPSFCSKEEREARRIEAGLDKPWFPISVKDGTSAWWLLVVPAAGAGGYVLIRNARRLRASAIANYALARLPWNVAFLSLLAGSIVTAWYDVDSNRLWIGDRPPPPPMLDERWLLVLPVATLLAFALALMMTRPRAMTIPRAD